MYNFEEAIKSGLSEAQITQYLSSKGREKEASAYFGKESLTSKLGQDLSSRKQNIEQDIELASEGGISSPELILRGLGQGAGVLGDVAGRLIGTGISKITPEPVKKAGASLLNTDLAKQGMEALAKGIDVYQNWKNKNTRLAENLEATLNIASLVPIGKSVKVGSDIAKTTSRTSLSYLDNMSQLIAERSQKIKAIPNAAESIKRGAFNVFERGKGKVKASLEKSQRIRTLPEPEARLVSAGIDERVLDFVKTSKSRDIDSYKNMFNLAESKMKPGGLRVVNQPVEEVGKNVLRRVDYILKQRKSVGKQIGDVVGKTPNQFFSIKQEVGEFTDYLRSLGVRVGQGGKLINTGIVPSVDMGAYQLMYDLIKNGGSTHKKLDGIRRRIFKEFDLAKARQQPFSDTANTTAEVYRRILAKPIEKVTGGKYMKLNTKFAEMSEGLRNFVNLLGYKGDLDEIAEKTLKTGEVARRMLGNAADRPITVLSEIENIAKKFGMKIDDSVWDQLQFADFLEDLFGTTQRNALKGQVQRAGQELGLENVLQKGVRGAIFDTLKGLTSPERQELIERFKSFLFSEIRERPKSV